MIPVNVIVNLHGDVWIECRVIRAIRHKNGEWECLIKLDDGVLQYTIVS